MMTQILILVCSLVMNAGSATDYRTAVISHERSCKTLFDSLTQKQVYVAADVLPVNEGGERELRKQLGEISLSEFPGDYDPDFMVAFIVETDGSIQGERITRDKTNQVGRKMLKIVKEFKWTPASCKNKPVPFLYKLPLIIDVAEN